MLHNGELHRRIRAVNRDASGLGSSPYWRARFRRIAGSRGIIHSRYANDDFGGLIGSGVLPPIPVLVYAIVGAILGDIVSYVLGRLAGPRVVYKWPLNRHRHGVAWTRLFFRRYGFSAVFFGRFLGPIRCTVPLVAGMMAMDQRRFQVANVFSALAWAPIMFAPGWFIGHRVRELEEISEPALFAFMALIGAVMVVSLIITARLFRRQPRRRRSSAAVSTERQI